MIPYGNRFWKTVFARNLLPELILYTVTRFWQSRDEVTPFRKKIVGRNTFLAWTRP